MVSKRSIPLNAFEDGAVQNGANPISTITWCQGEDQGAATAVLKDRLQQVLKVNPWLVGTVVSRDGKNYLEYCDYGDSSTKEEEEKRTSAIFRQLTADEASLTPKTPFDELGRMCVQANLISEFKFDRAKPVFQISIMPSASKEKTNTFAIIVTMSHVVGDGDTYYRIYHMLLSGQSIVALDPQRIDLDLTQQHEQMGKWECGVLNSGGFILSAIRGLLAAKILGLFSKNFRPTVETVLVDMEKVKEIKANYQKNSAEKSEKPDFVSTNDIITSWYFNNSACQHGMMAINLRGRLENYDSNKAGNYENLIYYRIPEDCKSPGLIRRSLATLKRVVTPTKTATTGELAGGSFAIASSWASFSGASLQLSQDCQLLAHLPLYNATASPTTISMCILFRYTPTQLGVMVMGTPKESSGLKGAPFAATSSVKPIYHF